MGPGAVARGEGLGRPPPPPLRPRPPAAAQFTRWVTPSTCRKTTTKRSVTTRRRTAPAVRPRPRPRAAAASRTATRRADDGGGRHPRAPLGERAAGRTRHPRRARVARRPSSPPPSPDHEGAPKHAGDTDPRATLHLPRPEEGRPGEQDAEPALVRPFDPVERQRLLGEPLAENTPTTTATIAIREAMRGTLRRPFVLHAGRGFRRSRTRRGAPRRIGHQGRRTRSTRRSRGCPPPRCSPVSRARL